LFAKKRSHRLLMAIKELEFVEDIRIIIRWATPHHRRNTTRQTDRQTDSNNSHTHTHNSTKNPHQLLNPKNLKMQLSKSLILTLIAGSFLGTALPLASQPSQHPNQDLTHTNHRAHLTPRQTIVEAQPAATPQEALPSAVPTLSTADATATAATSSPPSSPPSASASASDPPTSLWTADGGWTFIALGILVMVVPVLAFLLTRYLDSKVACPAPQPAAADAEQRAPHDAAYTDWEMRRLWAAAEAGDESARAECEALWRVKKAEADAEAEEEARWLAQKAQWDAEHKVWLDAGEARVEAVRQEEREVVAAREAAVQEAAKREEEF
jgi:hypothetical protein